MLCFDLNLKQLQHEMGKAGEKTALSSQKLEIDELNDTVEQQKAEIERLRWLLDDTGAGNLLSLSPAGREASCSAAVHISH